MSIFLNNCVKFIFTIFQKVFWYFMPYNLLFYFNHVLHVIYIYLTIFTYMIIHILLICSVPLRLDY